MADNLNRLVLLNRLVFLNRLAYPQSAAQPRTAASSRAPNDSCGGPSMPPMPPTSPHPLVTPPDAGAIAVGRVTPAIAPRPQRAPDPRESVTGHALHPGWTICFRAARRRSPETTVCYPKKIRASFLSPAQACVGESAPLASDATSTFSARARPESFGTAPPQRPKKTRAGDLSAQAGFPCASTGNYQPAASPTTTPTDTVAPVAERRAMAPKHALELKRLEATSPYAHSAWQTELSRLGLLTKYPRIVEGLKPAWLRPGDRANS